MQEIGLAVPSSGIAHTLEEADEVVERIGLPVIIRPAFILGGKGTGIASNARGVRSRSLATGSTRARSARSSSSARSRAGRSTSSRSCATERTTAWSICSIENLDPMGVHTGDSITVAPAQTLSDVEYQAMRDAAFACIRRVGVETGGSNVQFALDPTNGDMVIIEMNPRVSRSSALASKATGFPIAKIAARLAVGYTLDEIPNDITKKTPASFEPVIDYVVTKVPRWAFEKFPGTTGVLGTSMQSVGEAMAIGRTFPESLQKALRSLEHGRLGLNCDPAERQLDELDRRRSRRSRRDRDARSSVPARSRAPARHLHRAALRRPPRSTRGSSIRSRRSSTSARTSAATGFAGMTRRDWRRAKRLGFGDAQLAWLWSVPRGGCACRASRRGRARSRTRPSTPARPSSRPRRRTTTRPTRTRTRSATSTRPKVIILGSGPNRIGQGIEFDYCCVHAAFALRDAGYETIMVNCNPETVSTDYDTSDRLYFEPHHDRGRARHRRTRAAVRPPARCRRVARRADAAEAGVAASAEARARHVSAVDRPRRGPRAVERRCARGSRSRSPRAAPRPTSTTRSRSSVASGIPRSCVRATCSVAGRWRSCTTTTACGPR